MYSTNQTINIQMEIKLVQFNLVDKETFCVKWIFMSDVRVQLKVCMYMCQKREGIYIQREREIYMHMCVR